MKRHVRKEYVCQDASLNREALLLYHSTGGSKMKLIYRIKPPCSKCPYALGRIRTVTNPCPQCKANGYRSFELFKRQRSGNGSIPKNEKK